MLSLELRDSRFGRPEAPPEKRESEDPSRRGPRIRCPKCGWEPRRESRWACSCFHVWNTFDTRGLCPACGRKWERTQCLRCHEWSLHEDWYELE